MSVRSLADPDELRAFFKGLRRIVASLGHGDNVVAESEATARESRRAIGQRQDNEDREAVIAQAREKDAHAFAQWTTKEEQEIKRRVEQGEAATDRALDLVANDKHPEN